jgi:cytochrome c peroxidase
MDRCYWFKVMRMLAATILALAAVPVWADASSFYATRFEKTPAVPAMTEIGRAMFSDRALSASGKLACASCHDPARAYGPPNDLSVQLGGPDMKLAGVRAVPSLRYQQNVPPFTEHYHDDDGDDSIDQGPAGGHTWDGRAQSIHEQASLPLLSPFEMANANPDDVVSKLERAPYAGKFRDTFGDHVFADRQLAFKAALLALEVFQQSPADFYPYDSKYDAYLRGKAKLTRQEEHGLALFNNPAKGNCASCHPSGIRSGAFPQFTDNGFIALGVPRNRKIPANADPAFYDLGLCGPQRTDLADHKEYCGRFRAPSLRNTATRRVFFHNGSFHRLEDVVRFYAQRDRQPAKWYPRGADGKPRKFDDLPAAYRSNVNTDPPFGAHPGDPSTLSDAEIKDIVVFLRTLTDGYSP